MSKRVLICEDTDQVIRKLKHYLQKLIVDDHGDELEIDFITTQQDAKQLNSQLDGDDYDLVLLDYFAPDGNFHVLNIEKIGIHKVIAMSSMADKNRLAENSGVMYSINKNNPLTDQDVVKIIDLAEYILYTNS